LFAQQLPGEVVQQLERDRREQELQRKMKDEKKPPVIIGEGKNESKPKPDQEKTGRPAEGTK
jgi:hypothetical protein